MADTLQLLVDILRGRNYPQSEDDPCPCSTFVRVFVYNTALKETLAETYTTALQESSNSPFYSATAIFDLPLGLESVVLVVEVVETTRRMAPYVMFYGLHPVSLTGKRKHEEVIALTSTNPVEFPEAAVAAEDVTGAQLSVRYHVQRPKSEQEFVDVHADVALSTTPKLDGSCCIVPKDSQYVWVNLLSDARWMEAFRVALVYEWQGRPSLVLNGALIDTVRPAAPKSSAPTKSDSKSVSVPVSNIRTIGDVILKRWCCCRLHEVLTRLRLCAEAFNRGERSLYFTRESELSFRLKRKENIYLLREITLSSLSKVGCCVLRDVVDHLWIFFATGINHDPAGRSVLTHDARRRVREAEFNKEDKLVLHSCLLELLVPSLGQDKCNEIVLGDVATEESSPDDTDVSSVGSLSAPVAEVAFVTALLEFIGAMVDTLTETELVAALKAFEPAVISARQRIQSGVKEEFQRLRQTHAAPQHQRVPYKPGSGIKIDHLDILGRRKRSIQPQAAGKRS